MLAGGGVMMGIGIFIIIADDQGGGPVNESLALARRRLIVRDRAGAVGVGMRSRSTAIEDLLAEFEGGAADHLDHYTRRRMTRGSAPSAATARRQPHRGAAEPAAAQPPGDNIRRRLVLAGVSGRLGVEEYVAAQVVGLTSGRCSDLLFAVAADWSGARIVRADRGARGARVLRPAPVPSSRTATKRVEAIEKELPDVLDVLAISVEAGVGLEGAIQAVTERFQSPLADELGHMLSEMELGLSRREALQNLRSRTEIPDLNGFVLALLQADALGMPMTRVLQTQAEEMRRRRRGKVREAAAKLPVKLIFPLVMFILPRSSS
jgi:hypothetical protein